MGKADKIEIIEPLLDKNKKQKHKKKKKSKPKKPGRLMKLYQEKKLQNSAINAFVDKTDSNKEIALFFLKKVEYNIDAAIGLYHELDNKAEQKSKMSNAKSNKSLKNKSSNQCHHILIDSREVDSEDDDEKSDSEDVLSLDDKLCIDQVLDDIDDASDVDAI